MYNFYQPQPTGMIWVNSDAEALNYLVAPNSFITMRNTNGKTVYFKQADASGRPTCEAYDLAPHVNAQSEAQSNNGDTNMKGDLEALAARVKALEEMLKKEAEA